MVYLIRTPEALGWQATESKLSFKAFRRWAWRRYGRRTVVALAGGGSHVPR